MSDRALRATSVVFLVAVLVHGADHVRRGVDAVNAPVLAAGTIQFVAAVIAVTLVFRGHRLAPAFAIVVGFQSAVGFSAAHLLPEWSAFSDAFVGHHTGPGVTPFSWVTALLEIGADIAFGWAGVVAWQRRTGAAAPPRHPDRQRRAAVGADDA